MFEFWLIRIIQRKHLILSVNQLQSNNEYEPEEIYVPEEVCTQKKETTNSVGV